MRNGLVLFVVMCMTKRLVILTAVLHQAQNLKICLMTGFARFVVLARINLKRHNSEEGCFACGASFLL